MLMLELEKREMPLKPSSIDDKERTAQIVISTGAGVKRYDMAGTFTEVLELGGVDASRETIPLLDSHRQDSLDRVLGRVLSIKREKSALVATVRFARTQSGETAFQAVKDGDYSSASIGYSINDFKDVIDRQTGDRVRHVLDWSLQEVSLVPVPADAGAKIRSQSMDQTTPGSAQPATPPVITPPAATQTRGETNREIRALAETFQLGTAFADQHIDGETPLDQVRAAATEAVRQRQQRQPIITVTATHDPAPEEIAGLMGEAVYARSVPAHKVTDRVRPYMHMTTIDMARDRLVARGISVTGLSPADTITRALNTTSDFPTIFADTANRSLRAAYQAAPQTLKTVARQTTARDFRKKTSVQISEAPTLEKVNEAGEYKYGSFAEAKESYKIDTFGKIIALSRQALINDDLGAFVDLSGKFGLAAAEFEGQFLVDLLTSNSGLGPTMDDGKALFHVDHGNIVTPAGSPGAGLLSNARWGMRRQKGLSGRPINATPKFLLVPPEHEFNAEQSLAEIQPTKTDDVNPFGGKLNLLVEARLTDVHRWYVVADPAQLEGLEYAYLQGEEGPQTETRAGFEVDGVEVKVRLDFGAAFLDWRGWSTNAGE